MSGFHYLKLLEKTVSSGIPEHDAHCKNILFKIRVNQIHILCKYALKNAKN